MIIKKTVLDELFAFKKEVPVITPLSAFKPQEQPKPHPQVFEQPQPKKIAQVRELQPGESISTVKGHPEEKTNNSEKTTKEPETGKHESWDRDITELERYFSTATLPTIPVKLNPYTMLTNADIFIRSHFAIVKANNGNRTFLPYLNRLQELKQISINH